MTIDDALNSMNLSELLTTVVGERYLLERGARGRFEQLVTWTEITEVLRRSRFSGKRLALAQNGRMIAPDEYMRQIDDRDGRTVDARRLERLLRGGATLIMNQVDELFPGVQSFAESCEEAFRIPVYVNLYAGWRTDKGFDLHWDGHDTLILQIAGRKGWTVYEPTVLHPMDGLDERPPKPTADPVWAGQLEDGDVLYMPRGWWHVACPLDEPTLHLTVGLQHRTGFDWLKWIASDLKREIEVRMDLPSPSLTSSAREAYVARLRDAVAGAITEHTLDRFMAAVDSGMPVRPRLVLPEGARAQIAQPADDTPLRLSVGSRLYLGERNGDGMLHFRVGDHPWSCDPAIRPALEVLRGARPTTLREMVAVVSREAVPQLRALVMAMTLQGAIWAEPAESRRESTPVS